MMLGVKLLLSAYGAGAVASAVTALRMMASDAAPMALLVGSSGALLAVTGCGIGWLLMNPTRLREALGWLSWPRAEVHHQRVDIATLAAGFFAELMVGLASGRASRPPPTARGPALQGA